MVFRQRTRKFGSGGAESDDEGQVEKQLQGSRDAELFLRVAPGHLAQTVFDVGHAGLLSGRSVAEIIDPRPAFPPASHVAESFAQFLEDFVVVLVG